jgi:hypothetical protein
MSNVVNHPATALMTEVKVERDIADTPEAQALQEAIFTAVRAYCDHLDRHGLFYDAERELVRASGLHVICNICGDVDMILKDGPVDRRYGDGEDPDPFGTGLNPTRPPSKSRGNAPAQR